MTPSPGPSAAASPAPSMTSYHDGRLVVWGGDCLALMAAMAPDSVDAIVTDPPYGLGFMGKKWDDLPPGKEWAEACYRVLKPGGHLLAFGGTRTWHRLAVAIEDGGFEIRDSLAWLYGSGFPKSMNVAKAIASGTGRPEDIRRLSMGDDYVPSGRGRKNYDHGGASAMNGSTADVDVPDHAAEWEGWGTALKPAFEPIVVGRKPLVGTVAANVLAHGTGALNIDACRIAHGADVDLTREQRQSAATSGMKGLGDSGFKSDHVQPLYAEGGRWPANVILDESQAEVLNEQSGTLKSGANQAIRGGDKDKRQVYGGFTGGRNEQPRRGTDIGGASRFFYVAREDESCSNPDPATTAATPSSQPSGSVDSAPSGAATWPNPEGPPSALGSAAPSTTVTEMSSRPPVASSTPTTPSTASASSPESLPGRPTPSDSRVSSAAPSRPTVTTTTTTSPSTSGGSAGHTTSSSTLPSAGPGGRVLPIDELDSRFRYCAKAPKAERPVVTLPDGTKVAHPTVKPVAVMRWLVRLVTPPDGLVLDTFAGTGTTGEACVIEGFRCLLAEDPTKGEQDYLPLIDVRLTRAIAALPTEKQEQSA